MRSAVPLGQAHCIFNSWGVVMVVGGVAFVVLLQVQHYDYSMTSHAGASWAVCRSPGSRQIADLLLKKLKVFERAAYEGPKMWATKHKEAFVKGFEEIASAVHHSLCCMVQDGLSPKQYISTYILLPYALTWLPEPHAPRRDAAQVLAPSMIRYRQNWL